MKCPADAEIPGALRSLGLWVLPRNGVNACLATRGGYFPASFTNTVEAVGYAPNLVGYEWVIVTNSASTRPEIVGLCTCLGMAISTLRRSTADSRASLNNRIGRIVLGANRIVLGPLVRSALLARRPTASCRPGLFCMRLPPQEDEMH